MLLQIGPHLLGEVGGQILSRRPAGAVPLGHRIVEPVDLGGVGAVGGLR
ncbi:MAG TPA: hypothetical protein VIM49_09085 [Dermatophilaceae bacterium]